MFTGPLRLRRRQGYGGKKLIAHLASGEMNSNPSFTCAEEEFERRSSFCTTSWPRRQMYDHMMLKHVATALMAVPVLPLTQQKRTYGNPAHAKPPISSPSKKPHGKLIKQADMR